MQGQRWYIVGGILLVALGVLFLLQNFNVLGPVEDLIWAVLFGVGGLVFLGVFLGNREHWWAIIPGFTLLGIAALIAFGDRLGAWGGALFLAAIGLSFWAIYALKREFWWAIIPGGALITVALVAALADFVSGEVSGGILFLGLGATFGLVYLLSTPEGRMKWALIPAAVLGAMGLLLIVALGGWINFLWPLAFILGGAFLIYRTLRARR